MKKKSMNRKEARIKLNNQCRCGSGRKYKNCCFPKLKQVYLRHQEKKLRALYNHDAKPKPIPKWWERLWGFIKRYLWK